MNEWLIRLLANQKFLLDTPKNDPPPTPAPNPSPAPAPDLTTVLARLDALEKENKALKEKGTPNPNPDDPDLASRARAEAETKAKAEAESKALESALRFSMGAADWLKNNESLLPKNVAGILAAAEKEKYESAIQKDKAIKSGVIQAFFEVQSNLDLLTTSLKTELEDFMKLTKDGKEKEAQRIYNFVFEPAFETLKKIKKAEALNKGHAPTTDAQEAYKQKLVKAGKKHYLGEKTDA